MKRFKSMIALPHGRTCARWSRRECVCFYFYAAISFFRVWSLHQSRGNRQSSRYIYQQSIPSPKDFSTRALFPPELFFSPAEHLSARKAFFPPKQFFHHAEQFFHQAEQSSHRNRCFPPEQHGRDSIISHIDRQHVATQKRS